MPPLLDAGHKIKRTVIRISSSNTYDSFMAHTDVVSTYPVLGGNAIQLLFTVRDINSAQAFLRKKGNVLGNSKLEPASGTARSRSYNAVIKTVFPFLLLPAALSCCFSHPLVEPSTVGNMDACNSRLAFVMKIVNLCPAGMAQ